MAVTRTEHCPQCGGFIGDAGCSSPRHKYSAELTALLNAKPRIISPAEHDKALKEMFYVNSAWNTRVGFGKRYLAHLAHHSAADRKRRKVHLLYAVAAVKSGKRGRNPQGGADSYAYAKKFDWGKMLVLVDKRGNVEDTFSIIPKKGKSLPKDRCAGNAGIYSPISPPPTRMRGEASDQGLGGAGRPSKTRVQPPGANSSCLSVAHDTKSAPLAQGGA